MKIIVVGCGKIGSSIIGDLVSEGHDIVAVDENSSMTMGQKLKNAGIDCYTIE